MFELRQETRPPTSPHGADDSRHTAANGSQVVPLALWLLVVTGTAVICVLSVFASVPNTPDEAIYIELARHFGASGTFEILGVPFPVWSFGPAYVAMIAPIVRFAGTARDAYVVIRGLNAFVFASAAIPVFFVALRAVSRRAALIVAAATIALPAGVYATKVMTESLAYTVALWAVVAALRVIERPTIRRQCVVLLCIAIASAVRIELLVLGPAFALACAMSGEGGLRQRSRALAPLLVGTGLLTIGVLELLHATSRSAAGAGAHGLDAGAFSIWRFGSLLVGSLGAIDLYCGVIPFACFFIVGLCALQRGRWLSRGVRSVFTLACTGGSALVLVSSAYLATVPSYARPPVPPDRYTFYLAPLVLVVFAAWIEAGAVRPSRTAWVATGAALLPVIAGLVGVEDDPHATVNALAFLPWTAVGGNHSLVLLGALAAYGALCMFLLGRRSADVHALIKPTLTLLLVTSGAAFVFFILARAYSPQPGWLDAHTRPGAIAVLVGQAPAARSQGLTEIISANRNLRAVYFTKDPTPLVLKDVETRVVERADGTLLLDGRPIVARYVLTGAETPIVGSLVAKSDGFAIYKVRSRVRLGGH